MGWQLGYCTNVHAGATLEQTRANLQRHARAVKQRFSPDEPMGVGLWLSASSARALLAGGELDRFAAWLEEAGLLPFTFNGFPYGDFHADVVKHQVYLPDWRQAARLHYTFDLIAILDRLLPEHVEGSISTLPLGWSRPAWSETDLRKAASHLRDAAVHLARLEARSGRLITLCLEPEPGCLLQRSGDVVEFFGEHLQTGGELEAIRRHLRVCHDVCHAAVMFEEQAPVLQRYREAHVRVGKVQVSSAIRVDFDSLDPEQRAGALDRLRDFAEDRYLHQTLLRSGHDGETRFVEDLPEALAAAGEEGDVAGEWRIHFHVPVYLDSFGVLGTTREAIVECLSALRPEETNHLEVETYAWSVLPPALQQRELADGIARELQWLRETTRTVDARSGPA